MTKWPLGVAAASDIAAAVVAGFTYVIDAVTWQFGTFRTYRIQLFKRHSDFLLSENIAS